MNNYIINSENTLTSNGLNNNSQVFIKKIKIKQNKSKTNKKDDIITNETTEL